jgi:hypothetical protein
LRFSVPAGRLARATRAYLAGIGTSGSLLAGAALMFILASALVAFRGWPHVAAQPSPGEVVVAPRAAGSPATPVARRLVLVTAPAVGGVAGAPASGALGGVVPGGGRPAAPATRRSIGTPAFAARPSTSVPRSGAPTALAGCVVGRCGPSTAPPSGPGPTGPARHVLQSAGGTLGTIASGVGNAVGSGVQQTGNTAAGAVQGVSPQAGGAVSQTGSGAASAVGGATQTIAGVLSGLGK